MYSRPRRFKTFQNEIKSTNYEKNYVFVTSGKIKKLIAYFQEFYRII